MDEVVEGIIEHAVIYQGLGHNDKVAELRKELLALVTARHDCQAFKDALGALSSSYNPGVGTETDFSALIGQTIDELSGGRR